jgi:hypothetical protein
MSAVFAGRNIVTGVQPDQMSFLSDGTATDGLRCYNTAGTVIACP